MHYSEQMNENKCKEEEDDDDLKLRLDSPGKVTKLRLDSRDTGEIREC